VLGKWLEHPLTRGLDIDDLDVILRHREMIQQKVFLRKIYDEWYKSLVAALPAGRGPVLEIGSGAGFLMDYIPALISSDTSFRATPCVVLDGHHLPFADAALHAIVMTNVLHHLSRPVSFFQEATRCLKPGGRITMIEPWVTGWSRFIYRWFHHEPFEPEAEEWDFKNRGRLSSANEANPWIIFARDRARFERELPQLQVLEIKLMMPFRYLVSGGVSRRSMMLGCTFGLWRWLEDLLEPQMKNLAMFARVELHKTGQ
jgi:SAM-dependent methyltransferase